HVAIGPQHVQQALLPALPLLSQRFQIGGGPTPARPLLLSLRESTRWPIPFSRPDRSARTSEFPSILFPLRANARTSSEPEHATHAHACLAEPQRPGGQQSLLQKPNPALRHISSLLPATHAAAFANPLVQPIAIRLRFLENEDGMNSLFIAVPGAVTALGTAAAYGAAHPRSQLFGRTVCRSNSSRKLALTFDDGPNPSMTPKFLDLLDRHNAKATF